MHKILKHFELVHRIYAHDKNLNLLYINIKCVPVI